MVNAKELETLRKLTAPLEDTKVKLKGLLYGASGVGKTVESLEIAQHINPEGQKILHIDTGEGWVSLKNHPQLKKNVVRQIFDGLSQITTLVEAIKEGVEGFDNYSVIIFDEFSTVAKKDIHRVVEGTIGKGEFAAAEFKQFNIATRRMEQVAFKLLELKETHHLIFLAHERKDKDDITKITTISPSFMDKFGATLRENVHVVGRMTANVENKTGAPIYKREIQVHPSKMVVAKSRIGGLDILNSIGKFNETLYNWLDTGGTLTEEIGPVELESEKEVSGNFSDQTEFVGIEVEGD